MVALMDEEAMGALLIPLLLANLRREELAESMESRLYAIGPAHPCVAAISCALTESPH
jgi:energy-coupling factor transporter transmembrane protein EcfT